MLTITNHAMEAIRTLEEQEDAAVRISVSPTSLNGSGPALRIELTEVPAGDDEVIEADGAVVFLDPIVAAFDDKVLDAAVEPDGVHFTLHDQDAID
jgi:iron-sulfur cluster assembly protein